MKLFKASLSIDGKKHRLSETGELKTGLCQRLVITMKFKNKSSSQTNPIQFTVR